MNNVMEIATKMAADLRVRTNREVEIKEVEKNNGVMKTGLVVKYGAVCPTIYVENFLSKGDPYEVMIDKIVDMLKENVEMQEINLGDFDTKRFSEFEYVAPRITMQLVNKGRNLNLLCKVPSVDFLDLVLIPSSVHEWIALPYSKYEVMQDLVSIIREVNTTYVAPEEVLGDKPYVYLRETDTFELM